MCTDIPGLLDRFMPVFDVRERREITVRAPATLVMDVACGFDIESLWVVRTLFRLRRWLLGEPAPSPEQRRGLVEQMQRIGWVCLTEVRGRCFVAGAACRPWKADPGFVPIPPELFRDFAEPDQVKITWTLEALPLAPAVARFATETRAVATDETARTKFRRYWRKFGAGIILIRLVVLPAVRRRAERLWQEEKES